MRSWQAPPAVQGVHGWNQEEAKGEEQDLDGARENKEGSPKERAPWGLPPSKDSPPVAVLTSTQVLLLLLLFDIPITMAWSFLS